MRILLLTPSLSRRLGGSIASVIVLAELLARHHEVEVWTSDHDFRYCDATLCHVCKVRMFRLASERFFLAPGMAPALLRERNRFDVINVFGLWTITSLLGALISPIAKPPVFFHTQGILLPVALSHHSTRKRLAGVLGVRRMANLFTAAVACNAVEYPSIRQWGFRKPIHILPNAVIPIAATRGALRRALDLPDNVRIVAYLNRFDPIKRVMELCRAFRVVQNSAEGVVFLLAGDADNSYGRNVQAYAADAGLRARFLGHLGQKEKWDLLADADVLCQYSAQEGHSNALTEALMAGVPVVASRGCNFEQIGTEGAGFVVDSVEEMAEATARLLADDHLRGRMSANALLLARNYTPEVIAATYIRIANRYLLSGAPDAPEVTPANT